MQPPLLIGSSIQVTFATGNIDYSRSTSVCYKINVFSPQLAIVDARSGHVGSQN